MYYYANCDTISNALATSDDRPGVSMVHNKRAQDTTSPIFQ